MVLTVAAISKAVFIALVLTAEGQYLDNQAGVAVIVDGIWVLLFIAYLIRSRSAAAHA